MSGGYTIDQTLWFVPQDRRCKHQSRYDTISKVGREWVAMKSGHRFRIDDPHRQADGKGYSSPGSFHLSKDDWDRQVALDSKWSVIAQHMRGIWSRPDHITDDDMAQLSRILRAPDAQAQGDEE